MNVVIDNREQALKHHFLHNPETYSISFENIVHGDVNIYLDGAIFLIIERKTLQDLAASIKDGRYKKQKQCVLESHATRSIIYLIEGAFDFSESDTSIGGISKNILLSSIINTLIRDNIKVLVTKDISDTIECIRGVCSRIHKDPSKYRDGASTSTLPVLKIDKVAAVDRTKCFYNQLCQVPGVSGKTAEAITEKYKTLYELVMSLDKANTIVEKTKLLKEIKLETDKGKFRNLSSTVVNNLITYFSKDDSTNTD